MNAQKSLCNRLVPDDKKAKQIGTDPWTTTSSRKDQHGQQEILVVSCLPQDVTPYAN
jgi:hypothetical protein